MDSLISSIVPRVPRLSLDEAALAALAIRLPAEGCIILTDRQERVEPIAEVVRRTCGAAVASQVSIGVAETADIEMAERKRLLAAGIRRVILRDPGMSEDRLAAPIASAAEVPAPLDLDVETIERRAAKQQRNRIRSERRHGHHAALVKMIEELPLGSCVVVVQSAEYGRFVVNEIRARRPDLQDRRYGIFVVACPTPEAERIAMEQRPDYTVHLPVVRTPGLEVARGRSVDRAAKAAARAAEEAAAVERASAIIAELLEAGEAQAAARAKVEAEDAALQAAHDIAVEEAERQARERALARSAEASAASTEARVAVCERVLSELMAFFARSFGATDGLPEGSFEERAAWLAGLRAGLLESQRRAIVEQIPAGGAMIQVDHPRSAEAFDKLVRERHGAEVARQVMFTNLPSRMTGLAPNGDRPVFCDPAFTGNRAFGDGR